MTDRGQTEAELSLGWHLGWGDQPNPAGWRKVCDTHHVPDPNVLGGGAREAAEPGLDGTFSPCSLARRVYLYVQLQVRAQ